MNTSGHEEEEEEGGGGGDEEEKEEEEEEEEEEEDERKERKKFASGSQICWLHDESYKLQQKQSETQGLSINNTAVRYRETHRSDSIHEAHRAESVCETHRTQCP